MLGGAARTAVGRAWGGRENPGSGRSFILCRGGWWCDVHVTHAGNVEHPVTGDPGGPVSRPGTVHSPPARNTQHAPVLSSDSDHTHAHTGHRPHPTVRPHTRTRTLARVLVLKLVLGAGSAAAAVLPFWFWCAGVQHYCYCGAWGCMWAAAYTGLATAPACSCSSLRGDATRDNSGSHRLR